jgi:2-keto-3-deoxy-L-rhamnonate aldolase RhmA
MSSSLKARLAAGESPAGSWVSLASPAAAEMVAGLGFEFVVVDTEHAPLSAASVGNVVRAVNAAGDADVVVRVAENDPIPMKRALDLGVDGIMAPQINTVADAEALVEAVCYPPDGVRGVAGSRASDYGRTLGEYFENANEEIAVLPQIETEQAVENARAIASVEGVDGLFVGPADLSADMGCFGDYEDSDYTAAIEAVVAAAEDADVPLGTIATSNDEIGFWSDRGADFLVVGTDIGYLTAGAESAMEEYDSVW